jgi:CBS domain-containing protein
MPYSSAADERMYFVRAGSLCKGPPITCSPEASVLDLAGIMQHHNITGIVVVENDLPVGMFSIRDLRRLIVEAGGDVTGRRVRDAMSRHLITVRDSDYVFEAILAMARNNIHRLGVVDSEGKLVGIITDTDLLTLQTRTPLYLNNEIEAAQSVDQLRQISARMIEMVTFATMSGVDIRGVVQLISHFNDTMSVRLIQLLERDEGISLPEGAAYLVLGSEGRCEQTLRTDQDSAIVYRDDLPRDRFVQLERFAVRLIDALESLGVPRCPGDTMASNPLWRHSLSEWKQLVGQWITVPTPESMVNFGMFQDLRVLHGDRILEQQLHEHILAGARQNALFLVYLARNILRFPPPLGMFNRFKVERSGEHRGKIDLKKGGIFAITAGVSLLALEAGIVDGTTWDKLELLGKRGVLTGTDLTTVEESFSHLVRLRLQRQLRALAAGNKPTNHVDPMVMNDRERDQMRTAFKGVGTFLNIIRDHFQLNLMSR